MVKSLFFVAVCSCLYWPIASQAAYKTGHELLAVCQAALEAMESGATLSSQELADAGQCIGYVEAAADMSWAAGPPSEPSVCLPPGVTTAQLVRGVVAYARGNPLGSNIPAFFVVFLALEEAFPCKQ